MFLNDATIGLIFDVHQSYRALELYLFAENHFQIYGLGFEKT